MNIEKFLKQTKKLNKRTRKRYKKLMKILSVLNLGELEYQYDLWKVTKYKEKYLGKGYYTRADEEDCSVDEIIDVIKKEVLKYSDDSIDKSRYISTLLKLVKEEMK